MCVFESGAGSDTDSNTGESRSSQEDSNYVLDAHHTPQTDSTGTLDRDHLSFADESVSLIAQQDTLSENKSEVQSSLLCTVTISARSTLNSLRKTLKRSHSSEYEACLSTNLRYASDLKDEEHFDISPQISQQESVQVFDDEQCQNIAGADAEAVASQVMAPNHHYAVPIMPLPLSPKETEEFDEIKSLEAINMGTSADGDPGLSFDLQNVDTTPFVKEELKEKIKRRRKQRGLPSLKVEDASPKHDILTPAEEEKRRLRRERNRLAAAKCRRKKKAKAQVKKTTNQIIIEQNNALMEEKNELIEEKAKLEAMLRSHLRHCNRNEAVLIEVPEITCFKINTSPLQISDSDSLGEEAMLFAEDSQSSDSDSIDLTDDVGNQLLDPSLIEAMEDVNASTSESLQDAVTLFNSFGGNCFSSSGNMEFGYLPNS